MKSCNEVVDELFNRRNTYLKAKRKKIKIASSLFCLCFATLIGVGIFKEQLRPKNTVDLPKENTTQTQPINSDITSQITSESNAVNAPFMGLNDDDGTQRRYVTVISSFGSENTEKYKCPSKGDKLLTQPLSDAIEHYGDTVVYNVIIEPLKTVSEFDRGPVVTADELKAEYERLAALDYTVVYETINDGERVYNRLACHAKKGQLINFQASDDYGYFISLYDEYDN